MRRAPISSFLLGAVLAAAFLAPGTASASSGCDRTASPGPDAAQRLVDSLSAGQTGCLRAGTYSEDVTVSRPRTSLRPSPGERVTLVGRLRVAQGADKTTVEGLRLNGRNAG